MTYVPRMQSRHRSAGVVTGAVVSVVVGFLLGLLFLGVLGRYEVPILLAAVMYLMAVASAFLVWAGFLRGE